VCVFSRGNRGQGCLNEGPGMVYVRHGMRAARVLACFGPPVI